MFNDNNPFFPASAKNENKIKDQTELIKKVFDGEVTLDDLPKYKKDIRYFYLFQKLAETDDLDDSKLNLFFNFFEAEAYKWHLTPIEYLATKIPKLKDAMDNLDIGAIADYLQLCCQYKMWDNALEVYNKYSVVSRKKYFEIYPDEKNEYLKEQTVYLTEDSSGKYGYKLSSRRFKNYKKVKFCDLPKEVQPEAESLILEQNTRCLFRLEYADVASLYYLAGHYEEAFVLYDRLIMYPYVGELGASCSIQIDSYDSSYVSVISPLFSDVQKDHINRYIKLYNELDKKIVEVGRCCDEYNRHCCAIGKKHSLASYKDVMAFCIIPGFQSIMRTQDMLMWGYDAYFWEFNKLAKTLFKDFMNDFPKESQPYTSFILPMLEKIEVVAEKLEQEKIEADKQTYEYEYRQAHPEEFIDDEGFHPGESPEEFWSHED